jgi:hypothetical protein
MVVRNLVPGAIALVAVGCGLSLTGTSEGRPHSGATANDGADVKAPDTTTPDAGPPTFTCDTSVTTFCDDFESGNANKWKGSEGMPSFDRELRSPQVVLLNEEMAMLTSPPLRAQNTQYKVTFDYYVLGTPQNKVAPVPIMQLVFDGYEVGIAQRNSGIAIFDHVTAPGAPDTRPAIYADTLLDEGEWYTVTLLYDSVQKSATLSVTSRDSKVATLNAAYNSTEPLAFALKLGLSTAADFNLAFDNDSVR